MLITSSQALWLRDSLQKWLTDGSALYSVYFIVTKALPYHPHLPKADWSCYWEQGSGNSYGAQP